jgi:amidohydrolase
MTPMPFGVDKRAFDADAATVARLLTHRHELHAIPEVAFKEFETARYLAERLEPLAPDRLLTGVGGTGLIADFKGGRPGRSVMVRADIDGLPIEEATGLDFRSSFPGTMHACGHDVHMSIALELARLISQRRGELPGQVRFAFQPAEEIGSGAQRMIEAGVLEGIDRVIGLHVWSPLPVGQICARPGPLMASADWFSLTVRGKGGHGAMPDQTVDAVVIAAQIVTALQSLVSRESPPRAPVVLTLGSIHGGTAFNIVAGEVLIDGTLRAFDAGLRQRLLGRIADLSAGVAAAMRGSCEFRQVSGTPPVVNDPSVADLVAQCAREVVGARGVVDCEPLMVGEDFAYFLEERLGCFFLLGGAPQGPPVVHHTPEFRIDEACLPIGLQVMGASVLRLLEAD